MSFVAFEQRGPIGVLTMNRPEALNALNTAVFNELEPLVGEIERDATLAALIITGEGRSFVAGADIGEQCPMDLEAGRKWARRDRKSTRLNSSHSDRSRMPSSA